MLVLQIKQQYETTTAAVAAAVRVTIISCPLLCKFLHVISGSTTITGGSSPSG